MDHDTSSPAIESQGNILIRIREKNACSTSIYGGVLRVGLLIDGRNSKFLLWRHQLARAARSDRDQRQWRIQARVGVVTRNAVGLTSILVENCRRLNPQRRCNGTVEFHRRR